MVQFRLIVTRSPFQSSIFHDGQSEPIGVTPLTGIYIWELPLVRQRANSVALGPRSARAIVAKPDNANWHLRSESKLGRNSPRIQRKAECRRIRNGISELCDYRQV